MLDFVPVSITILFVFVTLLTLALFYTALIHAKSKRTQVRAGKIITFLAVWITIQMFITLSSAYKSWNDLIPPLIFVLGILPALVLIGWHFFTQKGQRFIKSLPLKELTLLNIVRIPVEVCLIYLFEYKAVPEIMTFDGWNFDIVAGLTAPIVVLIAFRRGRIKRTLLLVWNIVSLALLLNIVFLALLSAPTPFQQFGLEQPNVALLNFPFSWLPTFVVPLVLFGHLVSIWKLLKIKTNMDL